MYDINIVIVNWKMRDDINNCLDTLYGDIKNSGLNVRVCIIDNSSNSDGIKDLLENKYPGAFYFDYKKNLGFGLAQNKGMREVESKYHFVLNPDVKFFSDESTLRQMFDLMEKRGDIGILGPKLLNFDGSLQYSCYRFPGILDQPLKRLEISKNKYLQKKIDYFLMKDFDHENEKDVDWVMGSAMFVSGRAMKDVGLFDERFFMYFEDCDWCRRMWNSGWKVVYSPHIVLSHKHRRDSAKIPGLKAVIMNPITRIHLKSWIKYFIKWNFKKQ